MTDPASLMRRGPRPQVLDTIGNVFGTGNTPGTGTGNDIGNDPNSPSPTPSSGSKDKGQNTGSGTNTGSNSGSKPSTGNGSGTQKGSNTGQPSTNPPSNQPAPAPAPAPTPTTTSSTSLAPTPTSSTSMTSTMSSTTTAMPTSTSSSSIATFTSFPSSSSTTGPITSTSFTTLEPTATAAPPGGIPGTITSTKPHTEAGPNVGAIIGGIAGGLVGLIVLVYLILIPVRQRAKRKKEVDWLDFGRENDHIDNDGTDQSIFRTPRAGVGDDEDKTEYHAVSSSVGGMGHNESYQMQESAAQGPHGYYPGYGHDDGTQWAGYGANVVGEAPYGMTYPGYYAQHAAGHGNEMYGQSGPYPTMPQQAWTGHAASQLSGASAPMAAIPSRSQAGSPPALARSQTGSPGMPIPTVQSSPVLQRSHSGPLPQQRDNSYPSMPPPVLPQKDIRSLEASAGANSTGHSPTSVGGNGNGDSGNGSYGNVYQAPHRDKTSESSRSLQHAMASGMETLTKPQRRLSGRSGGSQGANTDREEDFVLPYEREETQHHYEGSESPRPPANVPLHLVNPDD